MSAIALDDYVGLDKPGFFILGFYVISSFISFVFYAIDKSAAKNGRWRIKENTLHLLSIMEGWPGALLAQKILRHKSRKQPFRFVFMLTILLNISVLLGYYQLVFLQM